MMQDWFEKAKLGGARWAGIPGVLWISPTQREPQDGPVVLQVELDGELDLWRGEGGAIEQN